MDLNKYLDELYKIEEQIEAYYINLAELENCGLLESGEYNDNLRILKDLIDKEKNILIILDNNFPLNLITKEINKKKQAPKPIPISLGHLTQSYHFRLLNIFNNLNNDDLTAYAFILRNDINKILMAFLNKLIGNDAYKDIMEDLIFYKYNIIYMDYFLEDSFLKQLPNNEINLEANNFRLSSLPSYIYVDKSILVLESYDYINYLQSVPNVDIPLAKESMVIISIIELLARFTLCEKETLNLIYPEYKALKESELTSEFVLSSINEMQNILGTLKEHIDWAR